MTLPCHSLGVAGLAIQTSVGRSPPATFRLSSPAPWPPQSTRRRDWLMQGPQDPAPPTHPSAGWAWLPGDRHPRTTASWLLFPPCQTQILSLLSPLKLGVVDNSIIHMPPSQMVT